MSKQSTVHRCRMLRRQYDEIGEAWRREREDLDFFYSGLTYDDPLHTRLPPSTTPTLRRLEARGAELLRKMKRYGCVGSDTQEREKKRRAKRALRMESRKLPF